MSALDDPHRSAGGSAPTRFSWVWGVGCAGIWVLLAFLYARVLHAIGPKGVAEGNCSGEGWITVYKVIYWSATLVVVVLVALAVRALRRRRVAQVVLYSLAALVLLGGMIDGRAI